MTPDNIIALALERGVDVIAITDHNATRHCRLAEHYSHNRDIFVLCGAEITTKEEEHFLAYMPDHDTLDQLQAYLDTHLPDTPNNPMSSAIRCRLTRISTSCMRSPAC